MSPKLVTYIQKLIWKPFGVIDLWSCKFMLPWKPTLTGRIFRNRINPLSLNFLTI